MRERSGPGGRIPYWRTIFQVWTDKGNIEPNDGMSGGVRMEVSKNEAKYFTGFMTGSLDVWRPGEGGCK